MGGIFTPLCIKPNSVCLFVCLNSSKIVKRTNIKLGAIHHLILLLLLLPDPFRGLRAQKKIMEPQKPGNSPGPGPEVVERQRIANERVVQRVRSWTAKNEMRDVLGLMNAGAA